MTYVNFRKLEEANVLLHKLRAKGWRGYVLTYNKELHQVRYW